MARVQIYNDYLSIIPVWSGIPKFWNTSNSNTKIKEEPIDDDVKQFHHSGVVDEGITKYDLRVHQRVNTKVVTSYNNTIKSNANNMIKGSSSTSLLKYKNHLNSSKLINVETKLTHEKNDQGHDGVDIRLRTRTHSSLVECNICYITFPDDISLKLHKRRYNTCKMICHLCKMVFLSPIHLTSHRRSAHRGCNWNRHKYECHYCKLGFKTKTVLQEHIFHYHNINKISFRRLSRNRFKNRLFECKKISMNTKLRSLQQNMKGKKNSKITNILKKKKINSECKSQIHEFDNYVTHSQIYNNLSNLSTKPPLVKICAVPNDVEILLNDGNKNYNVDRSIYNASENADSEFESSDETIHNPSREYNLRSSAVNMFSTQKPLTRSKQRKLSLLRKRYNCHDCRVVLERLCLPSSADNKLTSKITNDFNIEDPITIVNSRPTVGVELKNLKLALEKLQNIYNDCNEVQNIEEIVSSQNTDTISSSTKILYASSLCQTRYTTQKKLIYHYLCFHTNPKYRECAICRSSFNNITELTDHLTLHCIEIPESTHEQSPIDSNDPCNNFKDKYMCRGCKKKFWLVSNLKNHERKCPLVNEIAMNSSQNLQSNNEETSILSSENDITLHMMKRKTRSDVKSNAVSTLNSNILLPPFKQHQNSSRSNTLYNCSVCHTNFTTLSTFNKHKRKFSPRNVRSFCRYCGTPFPTPALLSIHTRSHISQPSLFDISCVICQQRFNSKIILRQHMMHIHYNELNDGFNDSYMYSRLNFEKTCRVCKTVFSDRKRYIEHSMYYYDDNIIECTICHKTFFGQYEAHGHTKKVHYTEKIQKSHVYCCHICKEGFVYPSHLYSHMSHVHNTNVELQQDMYICINKQESDSEQLFYMCRICDEMFSTPGLLSNHQSEYSNTGEYYCSKCNRRCQTHISLERHTELSHSNEIHDGHVKCHLCNEVLPSESSLHCHLKHFHLSLHANDQSSETYTGKSLCESSQQPDIEEITNINLGKNNNDLLTSNMIVNEYKCAACNMKFTNNLDLDTHLLECNTKCINNERANIHTNFSIASIFSVDLEDYENLCDEKDDATNEDTLDERKISTKINYSNDNCYNINDTMNKTRSLKNSVEEKNFKCDICHCLFRHPQSLLKHQTVFSNSGDYKCDKCQRRFKLARHYELHIKRHGKQSSYLPMHYCKTCDERFGSAYSRKTHFAHIHGVLFKLRRKSTRTRCNRSTGQQSELPHRTNSNDNQSRTVDEIRDENETILNSNDNSYTLENANLQKIQIENIVENCTSIIENAQQNHEPTSVIEFDKSANHNATMIMEIVEVENGIAEEKQKIIEHENATVDAEEEIIIVENNAKEEEQNAVSEREEILKERNVSTSKNTAIELCDICGNIFTNQNELITHQRNSHNIELTMDTLSSNQNEFIDVESIDTNEDEDNQSFTISDNLNDDIIPDYNCLYDDNPAYLTQSAQPATAEKQYEENTLAKCKICDITFIGAKTLNTHLRIQHSATTSNNNNNIKKVRKANSCGVMNDHNVQSNFRHVQLCCKFCGKQFSSDQNLILHIQGVHAATIKMKFNENQGAILIGHGINNNTKQSQYLVRANPLNLNSIPINFQNAKVLYTKPIKTKSDTSNFPKILPKPNIAITQNLPNQNTTFPRLVAIPRNSLVIPLRYRLQKLNQHHNDIPPS